MLCPHHFSITLGSITLFLSEAAPTQAVPSVQAKIPVHPDRASCTGKSKLLSCNINASLTAVADRQGWGYNLHCAPVKAQQGPTTPGNGHHVSPATSVLGAAKSEVPLLTLAALSCKLFRKFRFGKSSLGSSSQESSVL